MKNLSCKTLYIAWACMFVLTAVLGFVFPAPEGAALRVVLALIAVSFFLPPWLLIRTGERFHVHLVGFLAAASIVLTVVLLALNMMSPLWGEAAGNALNAALIIVSAPMVCSNFYVLPLFLWGMLLAAAIRKK